MNAILHRKNMRRGTAALAIAATLLGAGVFYSAPAPALTVYCSNCGNWWTQALEKAEAVQTQINTAEQLRDALKQAMSLPDRMFRDITGDLQQVVSVYHNARSIGKDMANIENEFRQQFKGYESYLNSIGKASAVMPGRYEQWAASGLDNARTALEAAGINVSSFDDESDLLDGMLSRSSSAEGRLQAIQAGNEIAAQTVQQLQKLRDMMQTQITLQANYMAIETERRAVDDATREKFNAVRPTNSGRDKEF
ncbi:P-type conjugative transfer protein TrbJ [Escherichia coli]